MNELQWIFIIGLAGPVILFVLMFALFMLLFAFSPKEHKTTKAVDSDSETADCTAAIALSVVAISL